MVKEFQVVLTPPQNPNVANPNVTGYVHLITDEAKSGYKSIEITLRGYATVRWSEQRGSGENRYTVTYSSREDYLGQTVVLWSKETAPGHQLAPGSYQFQFSLRFPGNPSDLPPPFQGSFGRIVYELQGVIVKTAALKFNKKSTVELPAFLPALVDPNVVPNVLEPKILQVQRTLCCLCCESGPISITARIPRKGFCIGVDAIPFEADIENGSNRRVRYLQAKLLKRVSYAAEGHFHSEQMTVASVNSDPIQPGRSLSWKPSPLAIPATLLPTFSNCRIIELRYCLRVEAVISGAFNPCVDFDHLFLGNVPLNNTDQQLPTAPASIEPASFGYQEPPIPSTAQYPAPPPASETLPPYPVGPPPGSVQPPQPSAPSSAYPPQPVFNAPPPATGLPPGFVDPIKR